MNAASTFAEDAKHFCDIMIIIKIDIMIIINMSKFCQHFQKMSDCYVFVVDK